jgi:phage terminase small subunit
MASIKQRVWLEEYLRCWNATEAARRAGYAQPNVSGPTNKTRFAEEIEQAIAEKVMTAEQALALLSDQARADLSPFITAGGLDVDAMVEAGLGHLVKGVKRVVTKFDDRREVEIYDKQAALKIVLDHHTRGASGRSDDPLHLVQVYLPDNERDNADNPA